MQSLTAEAAEAIVAIVGSKGVVPEVDWPAFNVEWRKTWHGRPSMIVAPANLEEAAALVRLCAERRISITPQGGNTGLVGGQIATNGEVLVSMRRMRKVRSVSALDNTLVADAGVTLAEAQAAAAAFDRLFPLSIGSEGSCQIGGVISTNAGGVNVIRYGNTRDLVLGIEVVLPSGEIWNGLKRLRKDNTGYDLKHLFIGGEGTLGLITGASLKLIPAPRERLTVFTGLSSPDAALRLLARAQDVSGGAVTSFELMSRAILGLVLKNIAGARDPLADAHRWYALAEFSAGRTGVLRPMVEEWLGAALAADEVADAVIAESEAQSKAFWRLRHSMSEAMKSEGGQAKYDVSVPVASIPAFLTAADAAVERICPGARIVAFGHMGDGNIHYDVLQPVGMTRAEFDARESGVEQAVYDAIDRFEGSISAEHGVGLARKGDIARRKQPAEIAMMRAVKTALDPNGIMNPGKMI